MLKRPAGRFCYTYGMSDQPEIGGGRYEGPESQFSGAQEYAKLEVDFPVKIEKSDIAAHAIEPGETEMVVQRHGDYVRDRSDERTGSLTPESAADVSETAKSYFESFLSQVPEADRDKVDVLFVSSDTQYFQGGHRSLETSQLAQKAAEEVFEQQGLPTSNIHNNRGQLKGIVGKSGPKVVEKLREPQFLDQNPDFAKHLLDKYSETTGPDGNKKLDVKFWIAFETDVEAELRSQMGAEGPDDIADRTTKAINVLGRYAQVYHHINPDRRLIIWASTHYDTISPYVRREVFKQPNYKDEALGVELDGGITIDIDKEGRATTEIGGKGYEVPLRTSGKRPEQPTS